MIEIALNGQNRMIPAGTSLDNLLHLLFLPDQRIAVELNGNVVRRKDWPETVVSDSDKIEVVHFVGGG